MHKRWEYIIDDDHKEGLYTRSSDRAIIYKISIDSAYMTDYEYFYHGDTLLLLRKDHNDKDDSLRVTFQMVENNLRSIRTERKVEEKWIIATNIIDATHLLMKTRK